MRSPAKRIIILKKRIECIQHLNASLLLNNFTFRAQPFNIKLRKKNNLAIFSLVTVKANYLSNRKSIIFFCPRPQRISSPQSFFVGRLKNIDSKFYLPSPSALHYRDNEYTQRQTDNSVPVFLCASLRRDRQITNIHGDKQTSLLTIRISTILLFADLYGITGITIHNFSFVGVMVFEIR